MNGYYRVLDIIKTTLESDIDVNTVSYGDITKVDLEKQTMYPLSHVILNSVTSGEHTLTFSLSVIAMDIVDTSKDENDVFFHNNNEQDVLNTQLAVLNRLAQKLRIGALYRDKYQVQSDVTLEPFTDRFENEVAGWSMNLDVVIENDINVC